jgi:SAM-dependent methyltransferase
MATSRDWRALYAAAAFTSALLLFQVQPLLGKRLLPWFGGSPSTWTTCMLFFQLALLAGYALADGLIRGARGAWQWGLALALPVLALAFLPLGPGTEARPVDADTQPVLAILALLARHAGIPYLALATAAPLLQHWYERRTGRPPYRLYAWSNAGSLLGLLMYPFVLEPRLALDGQARVWSLGFVAFALALAVAGALALRSRAGEGTAVALAAPRDAVRAEASWDELVGEVELDGHGSGGTRASLPRWLALSCIPSGMLLAVTNYITVDVAVVPFLWVLPLALYLLSFIAAFADSRWSRRAWLLPAWVAVTAALGASLFMQGSAGLWQQIGVPLAALTVCALLCHGELARARPEPARLSRFYLAISAGGALGGVFVAGLAPLLFRGFYELQLFTIATHVAMLVIVVGERASLRRTAQLRACYLGLALGVPLLLVTVWVQTTDGSLSGRLIEQRRSFHGVLRVTELDEVTVLSHGRIRHGMEFRVPARRAQPTAYYSPDAGVGRALRLHRAGQPREIGVVGLGVGTLAAYGERGDRFSFYELSPDVVDVAQRRFGFLRASRATVDVAVGDGRLLLERAAPGRFDLLVLDAFASDSVPAHLLTLEAFRAYLRVLKPDGVIAANVANRHLAVERVIAGAAVRVGLTLRVRETPSDRERFFTRARWALLARDPRTLDELGKSEDWHPLAGEPLLWTDDFSDLLSVLR